MHEYIKEFTRKSYMHERTLTSMHAHTHTVCVCIVIYVVYIHKLLSSTEESHVNSWSTM